MVYKIVSKVLVNRLKRFLSELISPSQCAFVAGRSIFDNVISAHEIAHSMQMKRTGNVGFDGAKIDMSKAYDRVEWLFLEGLLKALGLSSNWVRLVMDCVSIVLYSLMINVNQYSSFLPNRGLKQGDPFPIMFLSFAQKVSLV